MSAGDLPCQLTYHRLQQALGDFNELLVDLNGKVAQHLAVFSEVKILKTVLILLRRILSHEALQRQMGAVLRLRGLPCSAGLLGLQSLSQYPICGARSGSVC